MSIFEQPPERPVADRIAAGGPMTYPTHRTVDPAIQVWVFACIEAIQSGAFDDWLHRIRGAVITRARTQEYLDTLVVGDGE